MSTDKPRAPIGVDPDFYRTLGLGLDTSHGIAYRDLGELVEAHCLKKDRAFDYGCGSGRSTELLKSLGFTNVVGGDIRQTVLDQAKAKNVAGISYVRIARDFVRFPYGTFDLGFSGIVIPEIPTKEGIKQMLDEIQRIVRPDGTVMILTCSHEGYTTDSESFECLVPEADRANLKDGDQVLTRVRKTGKEFTDIYWSDAFLKRAFIDAELRLVQEHRPVPTPEQIANSKTLDVTPRWVIYVLKKDEKTELPLGEGAVAADATKVMNAV